MLVLLSPHYHCQLIPAPTPTSSPAPTPTSSPAPTLTYSPAPAPTPNSSLAPAPTPTSSPAPIPLGSTSFLLCVVQPAGQGGCGGSVVIMDTSHGRR